MTWRELKKRIAKFSDEQLSTTVRFYSDRNNSFWDLECYIDDQDSTDDAGIEVKKGMPYLDF